MHYPIKTLCFHIFLLSLFCLFLIFPLQTLNGAAAGLLLWYKILLPSLLPFIILTGVIIKTQAFTLISRLLGSTIGKLFRVSNSGSIAIIVGFLCGYPMGAKVINDLYSNKNITLLESQYLLSFCNNTGPMFIISFFLLQIIEDASIILPVILAIYTAPLLVSIISRRYYHIQPPSQAVTCTPKISNHTSFSFSFQLLDEIIIDSITLIMKIGGYIMLFSILINLCTPFVNNYFPALFYLVPLLEITNGLELYRSMGISPLTYLCMIFLVSFGGLCAIGQTRCVLTSQEIKISHYFIQKIITAFIAVIISIVIRFFYS